ncbi:MAG: formylglycine-generating enzyme family protein [Pirellulaceae bacterium]|nr:formylglycine-generating enzyme family protein [Pirellulaceae bacterium]
MQPQAENELPNYEQHAYQADTSSSEPRKAQTLNNAKQSQDISETKREEVSIDSPSTKTRSDVELPDAIPAAKDFELAIAQINRLDDEFSRLKINLADLKLADELHAKATTKNAILAKAILSGRLHLRTSVNPSDKTIIPLVYVPAGKFLMGQTAMQRSESARKSAAAHYDFSFPAHLVDIQSGYFIGAFEVTVGQLAEFAAHQVLDDGTDGKLQHSSEIDRSKPACNISWKTASKYCEWLTEINHGLTVRLPTEIEWEYAARGNTYIQQFESTSEPAMILGGPWPVNTNTLDRAWCGCVAMNSNVQEWTIDAWDEKVYQKRRAMSDTPLNNNTFLYGGHQQESSGEPSGLRTIRGSSYQDIAANRVVALRRFKPESTEEKTIGFRIVVPINFDFNKVE